MPQSLHVLSAHVIFSTKERRPWLRREIRERVWAYQSGILQNLECNSITVGGVADHVHVLCNLTKKFPTSKVLEILKKDSSKFVKTLDSNLRDFHWQDGYGLFGVSPSHFEAVKKYSQLGRAPQERNISERVPANFEEIWRAIRRAIFMGLRILECPFRANVIYGHFSPGALSPAAMASRL
jgi:putative transposase